MDSCGRSWWGGLAPQWEAEVGWQKPGLVSTLPGNCWGLSRSLSPTDPQISLYETHSCKIHSLTGNLLCSVHTVGTGALGSVQPHCVMPCVVPRLSH